MKKISRQFMSILLAAAMMVTLVPMSAIAADAEAPEETAVEAAEAPAEIPEEAEAPAETEGPAPAATAEEAAPVEEAAPAAEAEAEAEVTAPVEQPAAEAVEEPAPEVQEEASVSMPAQSFKDTITEKVKTSAGTGKKKKTTTTNKQVISVDVKAPEGAFPEGTTMSIKKVGENDKVAGKTYRQAIEGAAGSDINSILAVDITFTCDGEEIEPAKPISVVFKSDALAAEEGQSLSIVHVADDGSAAVIANADIDEVKQEAAFDADSFSVYAIVTTEEPADNARLFVTFKQANGEADIVIPVKKTDINNEIIDGQEVDHFEQVLYDPGVGTLTDGQMFRGWTTEENYTDQTPAKTIEDVRNEVKALLNAGVKEGDTKTYYPMIFTIKYVSFFDELGSTLRVDSVLFKAGESATYKIDEPYSPYTSDARFDGWTEAEKDSETGKYKAKANGSLYPIGHEFTITDSTDDIYLIAKVPAGHWLIFVENGSGASYTSPQFIESEAETARPANPTRFGYTFDGWYTGAPAATGEDPTGSLFTFGTTLDVTTKVYAKWAPVSTARYTVLIWHQNLAGDGYDYKEVVQVNNAAVNSTPDVSAQGSGNNAYARVNGTNKQYTGFHLKEFDEGQTVVPEGTTVVNVYYDRNEYTITFQANANGNFTYNRNLDAYEASSPRTTIHTVTRLYDQDITDIWNFTGSDGVTYPETSPGTNTSWLPIGSSTYTARITAMQRMPAENLTFRLIHTDRTTRYFHYYVETVDGAQGERTYGGRQFDLYKDLPNDFNIVYYNDDFWLMKGFTRLAIAKSNDQAVSLSAGQNVGWNALNNNYGGTDNHLYFYYTRDKYDLNYMDGVYVDAEGIEQDETNRNQLNAVNLYYDADMSSYNKDQANYYKPTFDGYTFAGWYYDEACVREATFTTMPLDGITVYAKWIKNQYRVFLHPNVPASETNFASDDGVKDDPTDDDEYGMGGQSTSFRIDQGESLDHFDARREEYELVGWYTDADFNNAFNFDAFVANASNTVEYAKTESTETDDWGNATESTNKDVNRYWITRKLDLYAKWRAKMTGAKGIQVEYYAVEETADGTYAGHFADGSDTFMDPVAYYNDNSDSVGQGASIIDDDTMEFKYWVLQRWDKTAGEYVDTTTHILPGETFTVLKSDAKEENIGTAGEDEYYLAYTVRLRAHYGSIEKPTPTHMNWYSNVQTFDGNALDTAKFTKVADAGRDEFFASRGWVVEREPIEINIGYDIEPADTYEYPGCTFLGWAKKADATKDELFLKYEDGKFYAQKVEGEGDWDMEVTQVAADENQPYDDLYAVWEGVFYIYHSGTDGGNIETHKVEEIQPYTFADADLLYGGYYLEDGFTMPTDKAAYDGGNWTWTTPQTSISYTPSVGETVYLKEVPTTYLLPHEVDTFHKVSYQLHGIHLLSSTDDTNYKEAGFRIGASSYNKGTFYNDVKIIPGPNSDFDETTLTVKDVSENENGLILMAEYLKLNGTAYTGIGSSTGLKTIKCYWITPDGLRVTGGKQRALTVKDANSDGVIKVKQTPAEVKFIDAKSKITKQVQ